MQGFKSVAAGPVKGLSGKEKRYVDTTKNAANVQFFPLYFTPER